MIPPHPCTTLPRPPLSDITNIGIRITCGNHQEQTLSIHLIHLNSSRRPSVLFMETRSDFLTQGSLQIVCWLRRLPCLCQLCTDTAVIALQWVSISNREPQYSKDMISNVPLHPLRSLLSTLPQSPSVSYHYCIYLFLPPICCIASRSCLTTLSRILEAVYIS